MTAVQGRILDTFRSWLVNVSLINDIIHTPSFLKKLVDDYDAIMMEENEDFISPSPSGEDFFDEKSGGQRLAPQRIVDKNFFNGE